MAKSTKAWGMEETTPDKMGINNTSSKYIRTNKKQNIIKMVESCATGSCDCMSVDTKEKIKDMKVSGVDGDVKLNLTGDITKLEIQEALSKSKEELAELKSELERLAKESDLNAYVGFESSGEGVPILIKDNIQVKGWSVTSGSKILQGYIAPYEATAITNLKANGMMAFGRANMDEFAMGSTTESSYYGVTKNPHGVDRVPGGSSGGSAAAVAGGIVGVLVQGFKRAVFSSEAGIGSAAIVHATASVKYPVRQGFVALYEPFIDTIVICTMTALVIVITGVYDPSGQFADLVASKNGAALTSAAFGTVLSWFPIILTISVTLLAFSTMISWSYYGERAWTYVFGERYTIVYKLIFIGFTVIASIVSLGSMLDFSDLLILGMAFPNLIGIYILHDNVKRDLTEYISKLKSGELDKEAIR